MNLCDTSVTNYVLIVIKYLKIKWSYDIIGNKNIEIIICLTDLEFVNLKLVGKHKYPTILV